MDFISPLPVINGFNTIMVVVDRLSKGAVFIPVPSIPSAETTAKLFLNHVYANHGCPSEIVSDQGVQFTSKFWKAFSEAMGFKLCLLTAYHPQTDKQTERVNRILKQYLRAYVNHQQDNWAELLSLAQFSYNSSYHSSIKMSPYMAGRGYQPQMMPTHLKEGPYLWQQN